MKKERLYLSTIAEDAAQIALAHGLGLEIAEYCTAWNLDAPLFSQIDAQVRDKQRHVSRTVLHAPYNELFPCAIDPKARRLAEGRYRRTIEVAKTYGAEKVVIHGGFNGQMYFPEWYVEQSILFWCQFLATDPGVQIVLENVLETDPAWMLDIVRGVNSPWLRLCLDIGHANTYSKIPVMDWLEAWAEEISHFHIHNNDGQFDQHNAPDVGTIAMDWLLQQAEVLCPDATYTLEVMQAAPAVTWLKEVGAL